MNFAFVVIYLIIIFTQDNLTVIYLYYYLYHLGAIHTSELDRSEIDQSPKRSECESSNANWDRSKIDLNECEHFLKANWDRSQIDPT